MTKLFDLYLVDSQQAFQMRAPLEVIGQVLNLHQRAVDRIAHETMGGGFSRLYHHGVVFVFQPAWTPLGGSINQETFAAYVKTLEK